MLTYTCFCCRNEHDYGLAGYDVHQSEVYDIQVCSICWAENRDGWGLEYERRLLARLQRKGLPVPARNSNGLLPCE